jgi:hypothetical protein
MGVRTTRCSAMARAVAEAAADAAAEGDPVVGAGLAAKPALGKAGRVGGELRLLHPYLGAEESTKPRGRRRADLADSVL